MIKLFFMMAIGSSVFCEFILAETLNNSKNTGSLPEDLLKFLIKSSYSERDLSICEEKAAIFSDQYFELNESKLLLFLRINNYLCDGSLSFIPVVIDGDDAWKWEEEIGGAPSLVAKDLKENLYLVTQWVVEASYPTLYRSQDGMSWKNIGLPPNEKIDCCFEYLDELCFINNQMRLRFYGLEDETKYFWISEYYETETPQWIYLSEKIAKKQSCKVIELTAGNWKRIERGDMIYFRHSGSKKEIAIPKTIYNR